MPRPIGVDLFSGVGGLSLGFEQAGFDVVAAVEYDPVHAACHAYNFPHCATLARSVAGLSGDAIRAASDLGNRTVDVVFGGAPCQGFSLIGQRLLDDPRNALVREFVRIVGELDARYFVFENVKGLTLGPQRKFLDELIESFGEIGYEIRLPWKVLNAVSFGVPQHRERLFLLGARAGLPLPSYPGPTALRPDGEELLSGIEIGPSCRDALEDLPDAESFEALLTRDWVRTKWPSVRSSYAKEMRGDSDASWHRGYRRNWDKGLLTSSGRSFHTEISRQRFRETSPGEVEPISRLYKLNPSGVSNTLRAGSDAGRGAFTSPRPIHYRHDRCVTVREMARLHGFPDWFRFHTTKWHGARQIGNSVPPPLARAVAGAVIEAGGHRPRIPDRVLDLGDPSLLSMGLAEAARYWGIENPIGRRDRKSGARKRKQSEIEAQRLLCAGYGK
ncbi:MAG: DNA cytosine methyltransferase [Verrucomicrobia bacterium]|nr:DNA cytosine methyltransferase [Verrucomicrobiota bacterium]